MSSFLENWETASTVSDPPCSPPAFQMKVGGEEGVAGDWSCSGWVPRRKVIYVPMVCGLGTAAPMALALVGLGCTAGTPHLCSILS